MGQTTSVRATFEASYKVFDGHPSYFAGDGHLAKSQLAYNQRITLYNNGYPPAKIRDVHRIILHKKRSLAAPFLVEMGGLL